MLSDHYSPALYFQVFANLAPLPSFPTRRSSDLGRRVNPDPEPEKGFYYRSDHFEFARQGVPALYPDSGVEYIRSEEHTSELQSPCNLVCRLLLEKKKHNNTKYDAESHKLTRVHR